MKRYNFEYAEETTHEIIGLQEDPEGEYVKFEDVMIELGALTPEGLKDLERQIWACFGFAYNNASITKGVRLVMSMFAGVKKPAKCIYFDDLECDNDPECNPETGCLGCGLFAKWKEGGINIKKCHCGKDGHPLNSINCPVHGDKTSYVNMKYNELIMAVERKFPKETRHETALRYIRESETVQRGTKTDL
jgi:hypothetical protein